MTLESSFNQLVEQLRSHLQPQEQFTLRLRSEQSQFIRFSQARVRQTGTVVDGEITLTLMQDQRTSYRTIPITGDWETDWPQAQDALADLRQELPQLPIDPYLVLPSGEGQSREVHPGQLPDPETLLPEILSLVQDLDFVGVYAGGLMVQGYADSAGQYHWFATDSYSLDYSLFTPEGLAVKHTLAGSHWDPATCQAKLLESQSQLQLLARPPKPISRGQYRTYLAPAAIAELVGMLSWGGVSEASLQQGNSALAALQRGDKHFSPAFHLRETFASGLVPRFNEWGEVAPEEVPVIVAGRLVNTLVNRRSAQEYGKSANGANGAESLRSPEVSPGNLAAAEILQALDTGLYLSNLHYLNWSDRATARITGMTRYACFWVEAGEIVAPIENLRFDESLYRCWGDRLIALTNFQDYIPDVDTYGGRSPGGVQVPGMLVADFTYTL